MAAKKVDALEEKLESEVGELKITIEEKFSSVQQELKECKEHYASLQIMMNKLLELQTLKHTQTVAGESSAVAGADVDHGPATGGDLGPAARASMEATGFGDYGGTDLWPPTRTEVRRRSAKERVELSGVDQRRGTTTALWGSPRGPEAIPVVTDWVEKEKAVDGFNFQDALDVDGARSGRRGTTAGGARVVGGTRTGDHTGPAGQSRCKHEQVWPICLKCRDDLQIWTVGQDSVGLMIKGGIRAQIDSVGLMGMGGIRAQIEMGSLELHILWHILKWAGSVGLGLTEWGRDKIFLGLIIGFEN